MVGLGLTAAFQLGVVSVSGSAGLFADALHNVGDVAGTAALWIGFKLSRRPASVWFTYGWRRSEDLAGLFILLAIAVSAGLAGWDSLSALLSSGHVVRNTGAAFAAAVVGAVGNEAVAIYKIRVGRRIDSVPLIADGQHARVDGFASLGAARRRIWNPAIRATVLDGLRIHDLRHTAVSLWIASGANVKAVSMRAGHTSVAFTLDRYGHLYPDQDAALAARLDEMVPARMSEDVIGMASRR